jgi:hypothetical protein
MRDLTRFRLRRALIVGVLAALASAALVSVVQAARSGSSERPAAATQYPRKVTICHRTGSQKNPFVTITVSRNALPAHLRHGDTIGPCSNRLFTVCHKNQKPKSQRGKKARAQRTMRVRFRSLRAHMRHGDRLGRCKAKGRPGNAGRKKGPKPKQPRSRPRPPRGR